MTLASPGALLLPMRVALAVLAAMLVGCGGGDGLPPPGPADCPAPYFEGSAPAGLATAADLAAQMLRTAGVSDAPRSLECGVHLNVRPTEEFTDANLGTTRDLRGAYFWDPRAMELGSKLDAMLHELLHELDGPSSAEHDGWYANGYWALGDLFQCVLLGEPQPVPWHGTMPHEMAQRLVNTEWAASCGLPNP